MKIGPYTLESRVVLAPMAGVTDQPFRILCRQYSAALTPSEMVTSNILLWKREKSRLRRCHDGESEPRVVQIAGSDPQMMAEAAKLTVAQGAQMIDINMGCPAKKVLKRSAGSALLKYPALVEEILKAVVDAVDVPVSLKIRTGWNPENRNGVEIARLAEDCGIQCLAVHGRTRDCAFKGDVEYDTIAAIKQALCIPVIANGDITSPQQAKKILAYTGADGVMIGRAAQGRPWIFNEINHFLDTGTQLLPKSLEAIHQVMHTHLMHLYKFYGPKKGVLFARKHTAWYLGKLEPLQDSSFTGNQFSNYILASRKQFNSLMDSTAQLEFLEQFFQSLEQKKEHQQENQKEQKQPMRALAA
ncbi:MAG: tRNA dihydrouridine synthase DusB [Gammaproteobacteria bacterium]|nr:tRNA dihydrouridine synthase DusB [Gammaproteobacteria bacterium]